MEVVYDVMTYLPICSAAIGILAIGIYCAIALIKKRKIKLFLVIGCTGTGIFALYFLSMFIFIYLGWFPIPN